LTADAAQLASGLSHVLREAVGDPGVSVHGLRRLSGGASRETWSFDAVGGDGRVMPLIVRRDPPGRPGRLATEAAAIAAAERAGVPVPPIVAASDDPTALGSAFVVMERVAGETIPRKILRDEEFAEARRQLAAQCGTLLARLHHVEPEGIPGLDDTDALTALRAGIDASGQPHPAFELGLRWLADHRPPATRRTLVHGDFRNGNLIVGPEGVRAVLDWERVHVGDPIEDLGWLCTKAWRFGVDKPVGGFGEYDDLLDAYAAESGVRVDRDALAWWEMTGTLNWGVACIMQAHAHISGAVRSVELATIGRRVCENEWDLLSMLPSPWGLAGSMPAPAGPPSVSAPADPPSASASLPAASPNPPHDPPSAAGLVEAVREFLEAELTGETEGRLRFLARVAANALGMVERELAAAPTHAARHRAGLAALGVADERALAAAIRGGALDDRLAQVTAFVATTVADKLAVANPRYLDQR